MLGLDGYFILVYLYEYLFILTSLFTCSNILDYSQLLEKKELCIEYIDKGLNIRVFLDHIIGIQGKL